MPTGTVTSKGQITIPKRVRDHLGLKPGSKVEFEIDRGVVRLHRQPAGSQERSKWVGYLRGKLDGLTADQYVEELRGEVLIEE